MEPLNPLKALAAACITLAACSSSDAVDLGPPWRPSSVGVRLEAFSYWEGGMAFERARSELSPAQLSALAQVKLLPWTGQCVEDGLEATLTVKDADGSSASYVVLGPCDRAEGATLDPATLQPVLDTLPCLTASETRNADNQPATAPHLGANDGCEHGMFGTPPWLMLDVDAPGRTYTIRGLRCEHNEVSLALYDASGSRLIASAEPEPAPGCQVIEHVFDEAGSYALNVQAMGGDYFLSITHD